MYQPPRHFIIYYIWLVQTNVKFSLSTWKLWEQKPEGNRWGLLKQIVQKSSIEITQINDICFPSLFQLNWLAIIKVNVASWRTSSPMWSTLSSWGSRIFPHDLIAFHLVQSFLFIFTPKAKPQCQKISIFKKRTKCNVTDIYYQNV